MKFAAAASSIVLGVGLLCLPACSSIHIPNFLASDQVPPDIKAQPRSVESPPPLTGHEPWPRLGDVPTKPNDFSPIVVNNHYMNELEFDRDEAQAAQKKVEQSNADQNLIPTGSATPGMPIAPASEPLLIPPQLPKE